VPIIRSGKQSLSNPGADVGLKYFRFKSLLTSVILIKLVY
jgi:hypothetical protein